MKGFEESLLPLRRPRCAAVMHYLDTWSRTKSSVPCGMYSPGSVVVAHQVTTAIRYAKGDSVPLPSPRRTPSGRRLVTRYSLVAALAATAAFAGSTASADPAPPGASKVKPEATLSVKDVRSPKHVITCALFANKPNYSGGKITATGGISGCVPNAPDACASEVDLELYLPGPDQWTTAAASSRQHKCPPPARSTKATLSCDSTSTTYIYRTKTLATIVHEGTDSNTSTSRTLHVKCL